VVLEELTTEPHEDDDIFDTVFEKVNSNAENPQSTK
jgi:methyltransferase-like protein